MLYASLSGRVIDGETAMGSHLNTINEVIPKLHALCVNNHIDNINIFPLYQVNLLGNQSLMHD